MRFDPQAGFTPVDEASRCVAEPPPAPQRRHPVVKLLLAWMIVGGIVIGISQVALPIFAPTVLKAMSPQVDDASERREPATMSSTLARALELLTQHAEPARRDELAKAVGLAEAATGDSWMGEDPALLRMVRGGEPDATASGHDKVGEAQAALEKAERMMARGEYAHAQSLLRRALDFAPDDAQVRYKLGLTCVMQRDFAGARAELHELRKLDPSLASLLSNLVPKS
jgi:Flp pilus assembly protein TadD